MKKNTAIMVLSLLLVILMAWSVSAAETRINITISETVDQNVSFAKNFYLTETQEYCTITGIVNITNPSSDTVSDIYLTFTNTGNMLTNFTHIDGRNGSQVAGNNPGDVFVVHVVELEPTNHSTFQYSLDCSTVQPPLNIETNYTNPETGINRKVLAGHNWTVTQIASNDLAVGQPINNINITIQAQPVVWNGTTDDFNLVQLLPVGDYANVNGNGTSNLTWYWIVNGGTLAPAATANISFIVRAPDNVPTSNTYMAIKETLTYSVPYLASNLSLVNVTAVADLDPQLQKRIIRPSDNENNTNVTWEVTGSINVPINISYNLTKVTMWVSADLNPVNYTTPFGRLNVSYQPGTEINQSNSWTTPAWLFNYTDGSDSVTSPAPIVWLRPYFTILNAYNQIVNGTITQNGNDLYMKYIYVVNGYWLEVKKNITNVGPDQYRIDTLVENIGNAWTPQGLVVTVYDFVPAEFIPWNFSKGYDAYSNVSGAGFNGTSYRWTIPLKSPYNSSLGPRTESYANRTWNVTYYVNGTGEYKVSELYIVGLDPRQVDGAGTHEGITLVSNLASGSREVIYATVVLLLLIINVINFVMTRRINDKLNQQK